jgi:prephenate dehydrogenase
MSELLVHRVAIVGVGLIGGSLALALKRMRAVGEVVGCSRTRNTLEKALELGVIDRAEPDLARAVAGADLVVVATPVGAMPEVFATIAPALRAQTIVTDAGSVKLSVMAAARKALGGYYRRFVPGHPIAGKESSGVEAAQTDLFEGQQLILTPDADTDSRAVITVRRCWEIAGARVSVMDAARHDELLAKVSHLPHAVAFALVNAVAAGDDRETLLGLAAGGFFDTTRIASSDATMWRDIFLANGERILAALDGFEREIGELRTLLKNADARGIYEYCARARAARDKGLHEKHNHG